MFRVSAEDGLGGVELRIAPEGALLAKVCLPQLTSLRTRLRMGLLCQLGLDGSLSEDTTAGRLLVQQCESALLELHMDASPAAFECPLEKGGKSRDALLFALPPPAVAHYGLKAALAECPNPPKGDPAPAPTLPVQARVTFRLNRLAFVEMRTALRSLPSLKLLFPRPLKEKDKKGPKPSREREPESELNAQQRRLLDLVKLAPPEPWTRPILLLGSFGTGKTFTLAKVTSPQAIVRIEEAFVDKGRVFEAAKLVLEGHPANRLLICTQSNSAADLYIANFFADWAGKGELPPPLRIYFTGRRLETLSPTVRPFAKFGSFFVRYQSYRNVQCLGLDGFSFR